MDRGAEFCAPHAHAVYMRPEAETDFKKEVIGCFLCFDVLFADSPLTYSSSLSLSLSLSLYIYIYIYIHIYIAVRVCVFFCLSINLFVCLSLSLYLSVYLCFLLCFLFSLVLSSAHLSGLYFYIYV